MGTRNKSIDLHNHLFEQLERLNDEDLTDAELEKEMDRSKAMTDLSKAIIDNAKIALDAEKFRSNYDSIHPRKLPAMLDGGSDE